MGQFSLGLDIGHKQIKGVLVEARRGGRRLQDFAAVDTPPGALVRGHVENEERLIAVLKRIVESNGWDKGVTTIGITHPEMVVKRVEFPTMSAKELASAVEFELSDLVSFSFSDPSEVAYSYEVIEKTSENQDLLFAGCQRSLIMPYVRVARAAGLQVSVVDVKALSLPRVSNREGEFVFLDLGHVQTNVYIELGGRFRLSRILPVGGMHFTEGVAEAYKLQHEEAEKVKHEKDIDALIANAEHSPGTLRTAVQQLIAGFTQTLDYLRAMERVSTVDQLLAGVRLCGGGAFQKGLANLIQEELDLPVDVLDPLPALGYRGADSSQAALFASAAGLACRGLEKG